MSRGVRVVVNEQASVELARSDDARRYAEHIGQQIAAVAARAAPRRTGAGAASIRGEAVETPQGWQVQVGWDRRHFYLAFHEFGTKHQPARPFLQPAADQQYQ